MTSTSSSVKNSSNATDVANGGADPDDDLDPAIKALSDQQFEQKLATWAKSKYMKCKTDITPIRNQWYINLGFYKGDQYITLQGNRLLRAPHVPGRVRTVINRIRPAIRTEISRMTSQKPVANVVPASSEEEDISSAEAGEAAWEYISATKGVDTAFKQAAFWTSVCGVGYVKAVWDDDVEDESSSVDEEQAINGDFCYTAPSPFHIMVPDSLELNIQRQPYILHIYTMSVEEVKDRWPDKIDPDHTPTVVSTNEIMETRYLNLTGAESTAKPDACLVIEAWVKPNATNLLPTGGMFITVDNTVVYKTTDGLPYEHGDYPFTKLENVASGSYWTTSMIEDLLPLQKEYNRSRSQLVEMRNATMKAGYFVQQGAVDTNKWTSKPGQLIEIKPGFKEPVPITIPQAPSYLPAEQESMLQDMEDISGQHQVSKGQAPGGVTAATAINFLQERDDSYLAPVYDSIEKGMQSVAWQTLQLALQYWDEPRLIKAVGPDQVGASMRLKSADLKNGTDIRIETGSAMPVSKAARNSLFMDMMNRGLIPPAQGLDLMELPNMQSYYDIAKVDERQARRENMQMSTIDPAQVQMAVQKAQDMKNQFLIQHGFVKPPDPNAQPQIDPMSGMPMPPQPEPDEMAARNDPVTAQLLDKFDAPMFPVHDWDNDDVHIMWHENFMKGQRFETLDPAVQDQFIKHDNAHKAKQQQKALSNMMMQGQAGGAPGGPPNAGGPSGPGGSTAKGPNGGHNAGGNNQFSNATAPGSQPVDAGQPQ